MSEIDYAALEALERYATPGPWDNGNLEQDKTLIRNSRLSATLGTATVEDANFVVAIRNAAPALIAKAKEADGWIQQSAIFHAERDMADADIAAARALLAKAGEALDGTLPLCVNPHDGGAFEDGEVPALDAARAVLAEIKDALK